MQQHPTMMQSDSSPAALRRKRTGRGSSGGSNNSGGGIGIGIGGDSPPVGGVVMFGTGAGTTTTTSSSQLMTPSPHMKLHASASSAASQRTAATVASTPGSVFPPTPASPPETIDDIREARQHDEVDAVSPVPSPAPLTAPTPRGMRHSAQQLPRPTPAVRLTSAEFFGGGEEDDDGMDGRSGRGAQRDRLDSTGSNRKLLFHGLDEDDIGSSGGTGGSIGGQSSSSGGRASSVPPSLPSHRPSSRAALPQCRGGGDSDSSSSPPPVPAAPSTLSLTDSEASPRCGGTARQRQIAKKADRQKRYAQDGGSPLPPRRPREKTTKSKSYPQPYPLSHSKASDPSSSTDPLTSSSAESSPERYYEQSYNQHSQQQYTSQQQQQSSYHNHFPPAQQYHQRRSHSGSLLRSSTPPVPPPAPHPSELSPLRHGTPSKYKGGNKGHPSRQQLQSYPPPRNNSYSHSYQHSSSSGLGGGGGSSSHQQATMPPPQGFPHRQSWGSSANERFVPMAQPSGAGAVRAGSVERLRERESSGGSAGSGGHGGSRPLSPPGVISPSNSDSEMANVALGTPSPRHKRQASHGFSSPGGTPSSRLGRLALYVKKAARPSHRALWIAGLCLVAVLFVSLLAANAKLQGIADDRIGGGRGGHQVHGGGRDDPKVYMPPVLPNAQSMTGSKAGADKKAAKDGTTKTATKKDKKTTKTPTPRTIGGNGVFKPHADKEAYSAAVATATKKAADKATDKDAAQEASAAATPGESSATTMADKKAADKKAAKKKKQQPTIKRVAGGLRISAAKDDDDEDDETVDLLAAATAGDNSADKKKAVKKTTEKAAPAAAAAAAAALTGGTATATADHHMETVAHKAKRTFPRLDSDMYAGRHRHGKNGAHSRIHNVDHHVTNDAPAHSLLNDQQQPRTVSLYPTEFSDNTQLYPLYDSTDEEDEETGAILERMEIRTPNREIRDEGECVPMKEWQTTYHPSCNGMHELDVLNAHDEDEGTDLNLFGTKGFWRNAWRYDRPGEGGATDTVVLKTLRYMHNFEDAFFEFNRIDAVAMERLTPSPHVIDIYGFCGHSVLTEFADGPRLGTLADKSRKVPLKRLEIARDIASGLADVHGIDGDGNSTFVHLDVNPANVVVIGGTLKLNDFNIGILRKWNTEKNKPCGFPAQFPNPQWRSPEEANEQSDLTEKVDVFSMGHIFFRLICGHEPWNKLEVGGRPTKEEVNDKVKAGIMPFVPEDIMSSKDPEISAVRDAMLKCYRADPEKRPDARSIAKTLGKALGTLEAEAAAAAATKTKTKAVAAVGGKTKAKVATQTR